MNEQNETTETDYKSYEYRHLMNDAEAIDELMFYFDRCGRMEWNENAVAGLCIFLKLKDEMGKLLVDRLTDLVKQAIAAKRLVKTTHKRTIYITAARWQHCFRKPRTKKLNKGE